MVFDVELARQEWGWQHDTSKIVRSRSIGVETPRKFPGELRSPRPKARKTHGSCDRSLSKIRDELADEFELLRPFYPVRCKFKVCAVRYPSLEEVWCNNITVVGRLGLTHCDVYYCLFSRPSAEEVALPQLFSRVSDLQLGRAIPGQFTCLFSCFSISFICQDLATVQVLIHDNCQASDPNSIGFPSGFINWSHALSIFEAFLDMNPVWARIVSGDSWAMCRSVEMRIIAVQPLGERDPEKCVVTKHDPHRVVKGPGPVPQWEKRGRHLQRHIDRVGARYSARSPYVYTRDLGLDSHDDDPWRGCGGYHQNSPPPFVQSPTDMFGVAIARPPVEIDSSELSDTDEDEDAGNFSRRCRRKDYSAA